MMGGAAERACDSWSKVGARSRQDGAAFGGGGSEVLPYALEGRGIR